MMIELHKANLVTARMAPARLTGFDHIRRYWDPHRGCFAAKVLPGEYYVSGSREIIVTVLGSCVAACIRDPQLGIGGMNHFMLPFQAGPHGIHATLDNGEATRYGNVAMEHLINAILRMGGNKGRLEIKLFGGGKILEQLSDIGKRNITFVKEYLDLEGLRVTAEDLGGPHPRKLVFNPITGRARVKKLKELNNETIINREMHYLESLRAQPLEGDIELF